LRATKWLIEILETAVNPEGSGGFGDVGVKGFDDGAELLFDDAALELEREGEAAVIEREIFGSRANRLDVRIARDAR